MRVYKTSRPIETKNEIKVEQKVALMESESKPTPKRRGRPRKGV
jgi:hypothetical protein